jgi:hypothetical protein
MKKYIVGYISFFDNVLTVELIEADNWREALSKHSAMLDDEGKPDDLAWMPDDIEDAKEEAFNADFAFDVKEI